MLCAGGLLSFCSYTICKNSLVFTYVTYPKTVNRYFKGFIFKLVQKKIKVILCHTVTNTRHFFKYKIKPKQFDPITAVSL